MTPSTLFKATLLALASLGGVAAQAQTFSLSAAGTEVAQSFSAGTYSIQFVDGGADFTAYSLRDTDSNPATVTPQQSFRTLSSYTIDATTVEFGSTIVPRPGGTGTMHAEYGTIGEALAAANDNPAFFTLTAPTTSVIFRVADNNYTDNTFGVTLNVSPVPEPSTYAMMLAGLAMTGAVVRRRRRDV